MKRLIILMICCLLIFTGCSQGENSARQEFSENDPDAIELDAVDVQIYDNEGQDITEEVIKLWEKANQVYNVDDTDFFDVDMAEPILLFEDAPAYFVLTGYDDRVNTVFTENGKLQLERTTIGGTYALIQKVDGNVYRMGPWKTGVYYGDALTGANMVESSADKLVLNMKYSIRAFGDEMLDGNVNFTVKKVDGVWLVDDYAYPESNQQQDSLSEDEMIELATNLMREGEQIFWWYHSDYPDTLDLDMDEDNWIQGDWQTYARVGRFGTMAELKSATEAIFSREFCETHFYDKVADYQKFHEIDGVLYHNLQSGGMGWIFALPKEYSVKTADGNTIILTAVCDGLDNREGADGETEYEFEVTIVNEGGEWKLNNWYTYSPEGWDQVEMSHRDEM